MDSFQDEIEYSNVECLDEVIEETVEDDGNDPGHRPEEEQENASCPEENVFFFKATFHRKLFRSQLKPRSFATLDIFGNTIEGVLHRIWNTAQKQINRKVEFIEETPTWCEQERPEFEEIGDFVTLQDQTKKKLYSVSAITARILQTWRGREIKVFVFVYSTNVETLAQHQQLLRTLITPQNPDRSGASSTRDDAALAEELCQSHPDIEGHYSSWLLWANFVNSAPAHEQDQLKSAPSPPLMLSKYFRWAGVSEPARLQAMHRGMVVANVVNDGYSKDIAEIDKDVALAMSILKSVSDRLSAIKARSAAGSEWFSAMETALQPEENELSRELASNVTNCDDTDHS